MPCTFPVIWPWGECHKTWQMKSQHWFISRHQAFTWANVDPDLCCHMASLGHDELKRSIAAVVRLPQWRKPGTYEYKTRRYLTKTEYDEILTVQLIIMAHWKCHQEIISAAPYVNIIYHVHYNIILHISWCDAFPYTASILYWVFLRSLTTVIH